MESLCKQFTRDLLQYRWHGIPASQRKEMAYRFTGRLERLFDGAGLTCQCCRCYAVMTQGQYLDNDRCCTECNSDDVATPW